MAERLSLHPDRFFDPDPEVRPLARAIHEGVGELPIVSPHGHVDPRLLAEDLPFPEPAALIVVPDHYILRMLYSRGIPLERLGIGGEEGNPPERDPRRIWQTFADHIHLFWGTPSGVWVNHTLHEVFGVRVRLGGETAQRIYDQVRERLASPEYRPRALFERFRVEVLATTDAATDPLASHRAIRDSGWGGRVIPTFRPDALFQIARPGWLGEIEKLEGVAGAGIGDYPAFLRALESRRAFFRSLGGTATDHGTEEPRAERVSEAEADELFRRALAAEATAGDQRRFEAHMLMEMARMATEDGMVMQLHAGSLRNHNARAFQRYGPDTGGDIPIATEYTRNLRGLLNDYGNHPAFRLILFTLDESTYSRELAPLAGHYPAVLLGPPWWFHDSIEGMKRYRERTTETAGIHNTAGFNDDTRAFCSIPARHDLSRRIDANWLAGLVARHIIDLPEAHEMARALAYDLARSAYRLDGAAESPATHGRSARAVVA